MIADVLTERKTWLDAAVAELRPLFESAGYQFPENVSVACANLVGQTRGVCYPAAWSSNGNIEIFLKCSMRSENHIIASLVHELVHAAVGLAAGHGKDFKKAATAIGLTGPMQATKAGASLSRWTKIFTEQFGRYPAAQPPDMYPADTYARRHLLTSSEKWLLRLGDQTKSAETMLRKIPKIPQSEMHKAIGGVKEMIDIWEQMLIQIEFAQG